MIFYECSLCSATCSFSNRRVKCPNCGKMSLIPVTTPVATEKQTSSVNEQVGEKIFKENKFVDDLTQCVGDLAFNKKVKFTVSQREERASSAITKKCTVCSKDFTTKFPREYRCSRCSRG